MKLDRHPRAAQSIRIAQVFFKEEIKTANRNVGWRQARHIRCSRSRRMRRDVGRARLFAEQRTPAEIIVPSASRRTHQRKDEGLFADRRAVVNNGKDQALKGGSGPGPSRSGAGGAKIAASPCP